MPASNYSISDDSISRNEKMESFSTRHSLPNINSDNYAPGGGSATVPGDLCIRDLDQQWRWNQVVPPPLRQCMHDIISNRACSQPLATAVEAWDGYFTYREVEDLSTRLAQHLQLRHVGVGSRIPISFEKSKWTTVVLLGIMKSGASFSLLDPSQPEVRLRTIIEQTNASLIITSATNRNIASRIMANGQVLAISYEFFDAIKDLPLGPLPSVPLSTPMYIIFTSGSTGKPKGVVISHENYVSGAIPRARAVGYQVQSRVFDFPSYAFDVSIDCMLCTLASGGCVCVPSEEARMNNLSAAIRDSKSNMVHMTPSVARVLEQDIIPSLDVLGLGGEVVSASDAAAWSQSTSLVIAYGPSECTVCCTINNTVKLSTGIGKGVGCVTWIVNPDDHSCLTPVGAVGELLIEGPIVGVGYLDEPEKSAEVFIEDPPWLIAGHNTVSGRHGRLYKTGDLVRYEPNGSGSIEFVGRKDQQVKLRGQRVELAEVEHHMHCCIPPRVQVAAEVIHPENGEPPVLVGFLAEPWLHKETRTENPFVEPSPELRLALASIDEAMGSRVPRYMVPVSFFTLWEIPSLVSGKTDRKKLQSIGKAIPRENWGQYVKTNATDEEPATEVERQLQRAWLIVLGTGVKIYRQSSFFSLGGDSLRAMKLIVSARDEGMALTVADVFSSPLLKDMASKAVTSAQSSKMVVPSFSILPKDWDLEHIRRTAANLCSLELEDIDDIYPCTPLQEALMALSAKVNEAYVAQRVVELDGMSTAQKLLAAFDTAGRDCPILRTMIVQIAGHGLVQVVSNVRLRCHYASSLSDYLRADRNDSMELGKPLVRYGIVNGGGSTGNVSFVLTMHHALYDGWSMPLVVDRVNRSFRNEIIERPAEFKNFIQYLCELDRAESENYWRNQLRGVNAYQFPSLPWQGYQTKADSLLEKYVPLERSPPSGITFAIVIRAAWALVASQYINSLDVVFGETLIGRDAPIFGAEEIEGPMITTVPVRVQFDYSKTVTEYLQDIQKQYVEQIPHEHFGLQHIRKLSPDAKEACELGTGLVLQPYKEGRAPTDEDLPASRLVPASDAEAAREALKFNTYALMLVCSIDSSGFLVMASFDSKAVNIPIMQRILQQLSKVSQQICSNPSVGLGELSCLTEGDIEDLQVAYCKPVDDQLLKEYASTEAAYIINPRDLDHPLPIGALGELVIQSSFSLELPEVRVPFWLVSQCKTPALARGGRLYKTGKLAKINLDGRITILVDKVIPQSDGNSLTPQLPLNRVAAPPLKQGKLRSLWSRILHVPENRVAPNDNFFLLGGDSISAMKLVSEARLEGLKLSVAQIFQNPSLYDMTTVMEDGQELPQNANLPSAFSLLEMENTDHFVNSVIRPQLANPSWNILDVLPARPLQHVAVSGTTQLPRYSVRYELMHFKIGVDNQRLIRSCKELVSRNEILRTVFVHYEGNTYSVIIDDPNTEPMEYDIDDSIEEFSRQLCYSDVLTEMPLGSCFLKWFLVRTAGSETCLILRISHAQYDEICLPLLLRQLSDLYEGRPIQQGIPFSRYVSHVLQENIPESIDYWRELLHGSCMTVLQPPGNPVQRTNHFAIQETVDISTRPRDITVATLPTAAWALCLARRFSLCDVTFGEVVSGRSTSMPHGEAVIGPCWQYVPIRVRFASGWTGRDLLSHVQDQHVASAAHEGMALAEIAEQCTDWQKSLPLLGGDTREWSFDSVVHQDVEHVEDMGMIDIGGRTETIYPHEEPLSEWKIQAFVNGDNMTLEIVTVESWSEYAKELLDDLIGAANLLVQEPGAVLLVP